MEQSDSLVGKKNHLAIYGISFRTFWCSPMPNLSHFVVLPCGDRSLNLIACLAGFLACLATCQVGADQLDLRRDATVQAVEQVMPSVVNIRTEILLDRRDFYYDLLWDFFGPYYRQRPPESTYSLGSGVIVHDSGYLLTNAHVINRASRIQVVLHDGTEYEAEVVAGMTDSDVALLKIIASEQEGSFKAIEFAAEEDLMLGESVLALGNPFGLGSSVSRGILSSKNRRPPSEDQPLDVAQWLQTDAAINPGNSGGPLVNLSGQLMGLNVAVYKEAQGIGFAIPIKQVNEALSSMLTSERVMGFWFGARLNAAAQPPQILEVMKEGPAYEAGFKKGDRIVEVGAVKVGGFFDLLRETTSLPKEATLAFTVERDGQTKGLSMKWVSEESFFNADLIHSKTGMRLQPMTARLARHLGMESVRGLLVAEVESGRPAYRAGIQTGFVLLECDGEAVGDLVSLARKVHLADTGTELRLTLLVERRLGRMMTLGKATATLKLE